MSLLVRGMCVNTWGGFEVKQGDKVIPQRCLSHFIDFNIGAKRGYMNPTQGLFSSWDNLGAVRNHSEDTVAFSQLRVESCRIFCLFDER